MSDQKYSFADSAKLIAVGFVETEPKLVFPEGVKWDKESRNYRTTNYNSFFEILHCVSDSYKNRQEKEKDKSCDLSSLVAGGGLEPPTSGL